MTSYLLLIVVALILALLWARSRETRWLTALKVAAGLLAALFLYDRLRPETVAEQIERKTRAMAAGVAGRDPATIFSHIADQFKMGRHDKASLRQLADRVMNDGELTEVIVWEFGGAQVEENTARISFKVKAKGIQGERFFRCTAAFVKDADGEWRLQSFQLFDGFNNQEVSL